MPRHLIDRSAPQRRTRAPPQREPHHRTPRTVVGDALDGRSPGSRVNACVLPSQLPSGLCRIQAKRLQLRGQPGLCPRASENSPCSLFIPQWGTVRLIEYRKGLLDQECRHRMRKACEKKRRRSWFRQFDEPCPKGGRAGAARGAVKMSASSWVRHFCRTHSFARNGFGLRRRRRGIDGEI